MGRDDLAALPSRGLGAGARYDAPNAPAEALLLARHGTAYFSRKMNELTDADLWQSSERAGWTRRHLIAHVGWQARDLAHLAMAARTGVERPDFGTSTERNARVELAATLPARALRHLFEHSAIHLNVEWRDLADGDWDTAVVLVDGAGAILREVPMLRAREIWHAAVALGNGGRASDIPSELA